jgi:hypothetical protein
VTARCGKGVAPKPAEVDEVAPSQGSTRAAVASARCEEIFRPLACHVEPCARQGGLSAAEEYFADG